MNKPYYCVLIAGITQKGMEAYVKQGMRHV